MKFVEAPYEVYPELLHTILKEYEVLATSPDKVKLREDCSLGVTALDTGDPLAGVAVATIDPPL